MLSIRKLLAAAAVAIVSAVSIGSVAAPAYAAGACDLQGRRVLVNGVWHKIVRVKTARGTRLIDCGAANAF